MGGEVRFSCRVDDLDLDGARSAGGLLHKLGLLTGTHWRAGGRSHVRDTYGMLLRGGVPLEPKAFQFGVRIEQPQEAD